MTVEQEALIILIGYRYLALELDREQLMDLMETKSIC